VHTTRPTIFQDDGERRVIPPEATEVRARKPDDVGLARSRRRRVRSASRRRLRPRAVPVAVAAMPASRVEEKVVELPRIERATLPQTIRPVVPWLDQEVMTPEQA